MVFILSTPVYATNQTILKPDGAKFTYIWSMSAGLSINSAGKAVCVGSVDASSDDYTACITVTLQRKANNTWIDVMS